MGEDNNEPIDNANIQPPPSEAVLSEEEEVQEVEKQISVKYKATPKFNYWRTLFLDKTNKETFGNATQCTIRAYNLDPVKQYEVAMVMGSQNFRKLKVLARQYCIKQGITEGVILDVLWNKAVASNSIELLQWFANLYDLDLPALPTNKPVITQNNQYNLNEGAVNFDNLEDGQLKQFIDGKSAQINRRTRFLVDEGESTGGTGTPDQLEPLEVVDATSETGGSVEVIEGDSRPILGEPSRED